MLLVHRGGLRFGALAGLFYAVQQVSSIARAKKGLQDIIVAGTATGAVFGATGELLPCCSWPQEHVKLNIHMQPGYYQLTCVVAVLVLDDLLNIALESLSQHADCSVGV